MKVYTKIVLMGLTVILCSCSSLKYVEFENSSRFCKSTREIVNIESKMIPSEQQLEQRYATTGQVEEPNNELNGELNIEPEASKILDEGDRFVTRPEGRFFKTSVDEGKELVYWIHYVSPNETVLDALSTDEPHIYETVNKVIQEVYRDGLFRTNTWEEELNARILSALKKQPQFKDLTKVFIHLGC